MKTAITEELFLEIGELLNSNLDLSSILRTFCHRSLSLFAAERASILALDPQGEELTLLSWAGRYPEDIRGTKVPLGEGVAGWVAATGEPLLVQDVASDHRFAHLANDRYRTRSFLSVPIRCRGRILGVLNITDTGRNEGFTRENLRTVETLALQVGMGVENLLLQGRLGGLVAAAEGLAAAAKDLAGGSARAVEDLIPGMLEGMTASMGSSPHLAIIGEQDRNLSWMGRVTADQGEEVRTLDYRTGFLFQQGLAALPLRPPLPAGNRLEEMGVLSDRVFSGKFRLIRSLLPPRPHLFGIALSAVPASSPETLEAWRHAQSVLLEILGLAVSAVFDREQIRRLDELKTELISTVSHEMRTPLTSIQGFADLLLREERFSDAQKKYLSIVHGESQRLNRLINNFLELARLESGELLLTKEPFDPLELIESVIRLLNPQAEEKKAVLRIRKGARVEPLIADRDRIEQVLLNLLGNAIKYGGPGVVVEVGVEAGGEEKAEGHTRFTVSDDGPGIPAEELPLVFKRFYRGILSPRGTEEPENKGTGLGLALAKEIVELHGGSISVEPLSGRGTIFSFTLPTRGLVSPYRGVITWHPGDEEFSQEVARRLSEGKTVGVLTVHVNPRGPEIRPEDFSLEVLSAVEELILSGARGGNAGDELVQSRPQGEFLVLTYASRADDCARGLLETFQGHDELPCQLAVGAAVAESREEAEDPEHLLTLSRQACQYVEQTRKTGYLKNRRT